MIYKARPVVILETTGAGFVILIGSALHFAFEWSGNFEPLAIFAAVNESIWEHLKLAFWPGVFWALIQLAMLTNVRNKILPVKGISFLITSVLIVTIFLSYTAILQRNYLVLDIGTFVLAVVVGSAVSSCLMDRPGLPIAWKWKR